LTVLKKGRFTADAASIRAVADERAASGIVVGLPRNMDGSEGPRAQSARAFARNLTATLGLPVALWDERLSTVEAERALLVADASRRRRAQVIDQVAAGIILQGFLDRLANLAREDRR
jgi:putative holliday junction resolvase